MKPNVIVEKNSSEKKIVLDWVVDVLPKNTKWDILKHLKSRDEHNNAI